MNVTVEILQTLTLLFLGLSVLVHAVWHRRNL